MIPVSDPGKVGAIVADLRAMGRLTQRELCADIGMHQARLSDWETGRAIPTLPHLVPILRALGYQLVITLEEDA
jgi:transcriptional regulator with XRE-family HTH domain